jgi:hypothetical protein
LEEWAKIVESTSVKVWEKLLRICAHSSAGRLVEKAVRSGRYSGRHGLDICEGANVAWLACSALQYG